MSARTQRAIVISVFALIVGTVTAYLIDDAAKDSVADGVRIGGVELGGLDREEALERVSERVADPLSAPIRVKADGDTATLSPARLGLKLDVEEMVDEAVSVSRESGIMGRLWRRATGGEVRRDIPLRIDYSKGELAQFVDRLADRHDVKPKDAAVVPSATGLATTESKNGRVLKRGKLTKAIVSELTALAGSRSLAAEFDVARPKVSTEGLAKANPYFITVDRSNFKLRFWKNLKLAKAYTISVGSVGFHTPTGLYHIQNKAENPSWHVPDSEWAGKLRGQVIPPGPKNPIKARWMGIYDGVGIHGTDAVGSLGSAASHGCLRMSIPDVTELYEDVPVQTPVFIA